MNFDGFCKISVLLFWYQLIKTTKKIHYYVKKKLTRICNFKRRKKVTGQTSKMDMAEVYKRSVETIPIRKLNKMKVIVLVGRKKTGKTTLTKRLIAVFTLPKFIFDPNMHYAENGQQWPNDNIDAFLKSTYQKRNSVIVVEEATTKFRSGKRQDELESLCVRCRHQNNVLFLCFHSLRSLPTWIFDQTDALYLFKTNDTDQTLKKFQGIEKVEEAFIEVRDSSNPWERRFIDFYAM